MEKEKEYAEIRNIRLYKIANKTIIEIEGAGEEFDQAILQLVSACLGRKVSQNRIDLEQINHESVGIPEKKGYATALLLTGGVYAGITAQQALARDGVKALVELFGYAKDVQDLEEKESVCSACKRYMATTLQEMKINDPDEEEMKAFIQTVSPLVDMNKMLKMFTYHDLDDFLRQADYEEKHIAYDGLIDCLIQRGLQ